MIKPNPNNCCGCTACEVVCGHSAIKMDKDALGFAISNVDESKCVGCSLCDKVCPFENTSSKSKKKPRAFAVRHKCLDEIRQSRSGAAFVAISDYIINQGGVVYGAGFDNSFRVVHKRATTKLQREEFRGSKYAQSDITGIYTQVRKDLIEGKTVLFSGTPCQVSALQNFIPETLKLNLYTTDIICHGVASPAVWDDFISYIKRREQKELKHVNFRDKNIFGWSGLHRESFIFEKNKLRTYEFTFYQSFLIREACSECPYSSVYRSSDLTLGDFWGWEKVVPYMTQDDLGVSLLLINSQKGSLLLDKVKDHIFIKQVNLSDALQPNLQKPTPRDSRSNDFILDYLANDFSFVKRKYWETTFMQKIKVFLKNNILR